VPLQVVHVGQDWHVCVDKEHVWHEGQSPSEKQQPETAKHVLPEQVWQGVQFGVHSLLVQLEQLEQFAATVQQLGVGWHA